MGRAVQIGLGLLLAFSQKLDTTQTLRVAFETGRNLLGYLNVVVFLLVLVLAVLIFGGSAVLRGIGTLIGIAASIAVVTYVAVHYEIEHTHAAIAFWALLLAVMVIGFYIAIKDMIKRRRQQVEFADRWDQMIEAGELQGRTAKEYLNQHPQYEEHHKAWIALERYKKHLE